MSETTKAPTLTTAQLAAALAALAARVDKIEKRIEPIASPLKDDAD